MHSLWRIVRFAVPLLFLFRDFSSAQSIYGIFIDTTKLGGLSGKLVFDITSNRPLTNRFDVINFVTDGRTDLPETQGDLVTGDLVQTSHRARFTRIKADGFFTELSLPFVSFGDHISFAVNVSESAPIQGPPPDEFSLYLIGPDGEVSGIEECSGKPNVSITITGQRGGRLEVCGGRQETFGPVRPIAEADLLSGQISGTHAKGDEASKNSGLSVRTAVAAPPFTVVPAWTPDDSLLYKDAQTFEGTLIEFCNRRCTTNEKICTGGAFGLSIGADIFYAFDDVSNLKAQVALVNDGENPLRKGKFGRAKVVGILNNKSILSIRDITVF